MTDSSDPDGTITWRELRIETERRLADAAVDGDVRTEAMWIVQEATGAETSTELADIESELATVRGVAKLDAMVDRRVGGEPIQYVLGHWAFRRLDLLVDPRVLIPRPETEVVAGKALDELDRITGGSGGVVVDLGSGSGAIGLSIVAERTPERVVLTDVDPGAVAVSRANLAGLGIRGGVVDIREGDWFAALPAELAGTIDLLVSNPPYVADADELPESVAGWEPAGALRAASGGLADLLHLVAEAPLWLRPGGALVLEMAPAQIEPVIAAAENAGFAATSFDDLAGLARGIVARLRTDQGDGAAVSGPGNVEPAPNPAESILDALAAGDVVLLPTDTVYGLAADPRQADATAKLFELKDRPEGVPLALLVASVEQARELIDFDDAVTILAEAHWPGALTIVGTKAATAGQLHIGVAGNTVGVRCPDHELVRDVAARFGPIAVTSANKHGQPTLTDPVEALATFPELAVAVDGGVLTGTASTVVDVTGAEWKVLRQGEVVLDD